MQALKWWQRAVFYQIYPRSFADGNGDGIGDFIGMAEKLDYLADLGIDAIWISPHYPSPQFDVGYDISDYTNVAPEYGSLDDFQRFLEGAHQRGLRVILDLVLNHTSHLHPWFLESSSDRHHPRRDWYIWRDGRDGGPPNNWLSPFGGSAWEYERATNQYYYHYFLKEQPDLNWRNPEVRKAMWNVVRFWLDRGVDGFRLDAIGTIFENPEMPDHPVEMTEEELRRKFTRGYPDRGGKKLAELWELIFKEQVEQPGVHELMQELRGVVDEYPDRVLVGENDDVSYYGSGDDELHMAFNFPLMRTKRLTPGWIRDNQRQRLSALPPGAWPCNTLGNHDTSRVHSRYGDGKHDDAIGRTSLALMLTMRGTPFLYNGEEIGMSDFYLTDIDQFCDPPAVGFYKGAIMDGVPPEEALKHAASFSRDRCRTPIQWDNAPNAGFSPAGVRTWLPVNPNYAKGINVAEQQIHPGSMLNFYKDMLRLRKNNPALISGEYQPIHETAQDYFAFLRYNPDHQQTVLVVLNLSEKTVDIHFNPAERAARCLFSTHNKENGEKPFDRLLMAPFEIFVGEFTS